MTWNGSTFWNCSTLVDDFGNEVNNPAFQFRAAMYCFFCLLYGDEVACYN